VTHARRFWIGVASRDHVRRGVEGGFAQLGHGKATPLRRVHPGDWLIYYSPGTRRDGGDPVQAFTGIGEVEGDEVFQADVGGGVAPWRRRIAFRSCREVPIRPLIQRLSFIHDKQRWSYVFRRGLVEIPRADFVLIAAEMLPEENAEVLAQAPTVAEDA
jgi:predicted RNA-binding protein